MRFLLYQNISSGWDLRNAIIQSIAIVRIITNTRNELQYINYEIHHVNLDTATTVRTKGQ